MQSQIKMKFLTQKLILIFVLFTFSLPSHAQRCGKKAACTFDVDKDFDYRGQSTYAMLYPGDTIQTKIVVYSGQDYNIFLCGEPQLGTLEFNILKEHKKYRKVVDDIVESEEVIYEVDEYGDYIYNEYGDYIEKGRETVYDTIWKNEKYIEEEIFFNNLKNKEGVPYWKEAVTKTQTLVVEVIVPDNASEGCADLYIGHRTRRRSQFKR